MGMVFAGVRQPARQVALMGLPYWCSEHEVNWYA